MVVVYLLIWCVWILNLNDAVHYLCMYCIIIFVWMTTTKNFAIKLSRRTSYVTLSGKCVYCLINFVLLKKMSTKKWMACRNFPHLYLMYFCVLFWNNQKLCKRISILFPNYLVYDRNSVTYIHTYLVWLVSVPYCLQILGVLGKNRVLHSVLGTSNKLVWFWNKIRRNFFTGPRRIV